MDPLPLDHASLHAVRQFGADAMSFPALKVGARWWKDVPAPEGTGARVPYVPSGRSWIAIGGPLAARNTRPEAVRRFCAAARAAGYRPVFFGVEDRDAYRDCRVLLLGQQSILKPSEWDATLRQRPRLREQLRRARAKGVTVRRVHHTELIDSASLRRDVARLRREWLASRHLEPMSFLVEVNPYYAASEHLYFLAERNGAAVHFLSAVPIYARHGWLMEDMLRGRDAPNGTTELVIDAMMRTLHTDPHWLTSGLTPLSGPIPGWMKIARAASVALYDFSGLRRFRERLRPAAWHPVWLAWDRGPAIGPIVDVLSLFAGGRLLRFALQSFLRHPNGPPWLVAVPLVAWTMLLAAIVVAGGSALLGFSPAQLSAWVIFDVMLAWLLFKGARRPRRRTLAILAGIAAIDAILSLMHLARVGFGSGAITELLRGIATLGPLVGTAALLWAMWRAQVALKRAT
jgi:hypothetical protein